MGCTYLCKDNLEFAKYDDRIIFQEKILPNFSKILSDNTIFYPSQQQIFIYKVFPKVRVIMIEYFEWIQSQKYLIIQLMKYPSKDIIFSYKIVNQCVQMRAYIVESYNSLLICDDDMINVFALNDLKKPFDLNGEKKNPIHKSQNIQDFCNQRKQKYLIKNNIKYDIDCLFKPSFFEPHILINGRGIYNYKTNEFIYYDYLIFYLLPQYEGINGQDTQNIVGNQDNEIKLHELPNVIIAIVQQSIYIYDKTKNYKPSDTSLKLNSKKFFFEANYFVSLNEYQNIQTLHIFNYSFESITFFEEQPNEEFKSPYYFNCNHYPRLFIIYEMKLKGYFYPFTNTDAPFFTYELSLRDKEFSFQLCTDEHLILLVELIDQDKKYYELQVILYKDSSMFQKYKFRQESLLLSSPEQNQSFNEYFNEKGFALIQNIIISLKDGESNLIYVLPSPNFYYDSINDYGIIIHSSEIQYLQFIDFSLIFPFSMNSFSFANDILIQPYQFGYYLKNKEFVDVWTIFYNSQQNTIYFYEFETQLQTKLQLSNEKISRDQRYLYKIEKLRLPSDINPEKKENFPNKELMKQIKFGCFFNDIVVIFTKEQIQQYLQLEDFESSIIESRVTIEKENKLMYNTLELDTSTNLFQLKKYQMDLPTQISVGKLAYLCYVIILGKLNLSIIDTNYNIIVNTQVYKKLPFDNEEIKLFKCLQYGDDDQYILVVSTKQTIIIYSQKLDILLQVNDQFNIIQDIILEETNQYLFIITFEKLLVYKYEYKEDKSIIFKKLIYFYLLSRNQNKISLLSPIYIAIISKSQITIYTMTNETVQQIYNIRNKNFNQIQNAALFENQFLFVWDVHRMYLYDINPINREVTEIFYREYTHIKILYSGKYRQNDRLFIRLIGVTATNVYDIKQEVLNFNKNSISQSFNNEKKIYETEQDNLSKQCIQMSNLQKNLSDQFLQVDKLLFKSHLKIYRILFLVQYDNSQLIIPDKSFQTNFPQDLSVIYQLNNQTIKIFQNQYSQFFLTKQLLQNLKFKNGTIDTEDQQNQALILRNNNNTYKLLIFTYVNQITFESIRFNLNLDMRYCNQITFINTTFNKEVYSISAIADISENTIFFAQNIQIITYKMIQNFMKLRNFKNVQLNEIKISNSLLGSTTAQQAYYLNQKLQDFLQINIDFYYNLFNKEEINYGFLYFQDCEKIVIQSLTVRNMISTKSIITVLYVKDIIFNDLIFENINNIGIFQLLNDVFEKKRFSILDIILALNQANFTKISVKNCHVDKVIKVNNTYIDTEKQITVHSKYLNMSFKNINITNIQPKSLFLNDAVNYNIIQVQANFVEIKQFYITNAYKLTTCFYFQQIKIMTMEDCTFVNITSLQNIVSISELEQLNITNVTIKNITDTTNGLLLKDANITLKDFLFYNPSNDSSFYIKQSAIKVNFKSDQSKLLIQSSKFYGIRNDEGNGTALNIINARQVFLQQVVLQNNSCIKNGGAIYAVNSFIFIYNSTIQNNIAMMSGGGFYLFMSDLILDYQFKDHNKYTSVISENKALIGGGIRYFQIYKPKILEQSTIIYKNEARYFGQDFAMYPDSIKFYNDEEQKFDQVVSSISSNKQKVNHLFLDFILTTQFKLFDFNQQFKPYYI